MTCIAMLITLIRLQEDKNDEQHSSQNFAQSVILSKGLKVR